MEGKSKHGVQYSVSSQYAENVKDMNNAMGYHNLSDRANSSKELHGMKGSKVNKQEGAVQGKQG